MSLTNFRQLLLKKADGDAALENLIKFVDEAHLADMAIESLEKMARSKNMGRIASFPVDDFVTEMAPNREANMLRDAIGHHASRYKAALKENDHKRANHHGQQVMKLLRVASRAAPHSEGKLNVDFVDPKPWETNKLSNATDTKGISYKGSLINPKTGKVFLSEAPYGALSYKFKGKAGDPSSKPPYIKELASHGHLGAWPMEHIRINGRYIPIDENVDLRDKGNEEHPFDKHPIVKHIDEGWISGSGPNARTIEDENNYLKQREDYHNAPHIGDYLTEQAKLQQQDPEAYEKRGMTPGAPVHPEVEPVVLPEDRKEPEVKDAPAKTSESKVAPKVDDKELEMSPAMKAKFKKMGIE